LAGALQFSRFGIAIGRGDKVALPDSFNPRFRTFTADEWIISADPTGKSCRLNVFCRVRRVIQVAALPRMLMW